MNEATIQAHVRLKAAQAGWKLFRNNVGVLLDSRGIPIRFGLANDSKQLNSFVKSGDLVGVRPVLITPDMVNTVIGQFVSIECKRDDWRPNPNDQHEQAQVRWRDLILANGGYAIFSKGDL